MIPGVNGDPVIIIFWIVLGLYWSAAALRGKRSAQREGLLSRMGYGILLSVGFLMVMGIVPAPFSSLAFAPSVATYLAADAIAAAGLAVAIWARMTLGGNWSGSVDLKEDHSLVTDGPYAYARHPIYTGLLLMLLGTALSTASLGAFLGLVPSFASFWIKLSSEERLMEKHFRKEYPAYKQKVKALIPFVF
jgi:protein-S-isoprenylcysteine O-methyltransferase Ste14